MFNHHLSTFCEALSSVFQAGGCAMSTDPGSLQMASSQPATLAPIFWGIYDIPSHPDSIFELQGTVPDWPVLVDANIPPYTTVISLLLAYNLDALKPGTVIPSWHIILHPSAAHCPSKNIQTMGISLPCWILEFWPLDPLGPKTHFWTPQPSPFVPPVAEGHGSPSTSVRFPA